MMRKIIFLTALALLTGAALAQSIECRNNAEDIWANYRFPEVEFVNNDTSANGNLFGAYISNPDSLERAADLKVCKLLYKTPDEVPEISKVLFVVKDMEGVAYTSGLEKPTEKTTVFSTRYLKSIVDRLTDEKKIVNEIDGVITHETVHIYQKSSRKHSSDHGSVIEGIADAIRYWAGVDSISRRKKGGTWTGAYTITGFFIVWLQENYDKDFLYKLNKYVGQTEEFHWDEAMMKLLNKPVQTLWDEYQAAI